MRRTSAQWPPRNEKATDRQGKISHLLRLILDNCDTLNDWEREFVDKMGGLINRRRGIEPATALSEKQARKLRSIIFKKHREYKHAVPSLPAGVKFVDEVRRLLKSQPNPNEVRNDLIQKADDIVYNWLLWDGEDGYDGEMSSTGQRYVGMDGDKFVFEISWEGYGSSYPDTETWTTTVKADPTTRTLTRTFHDGTTRDIVVEEHDAFKYRRR